jgi:hypothetical protein
MKMENKKWIFLIIFSLSLVGIISLMPTGKSVDNPNIWFYDQSASKGSEIFVDNISYINNMTAAVYADDLSTSRTIESNNQTRLNWLAGMGNWRIMGYPLSPMDTKCFNRTQFYIIAQYTGRPSYINFTIEITTFPNGTTFNRKLSVNSNGTKYFLNANEYCSYSYRYRCDALVSGFTRFSIKFVQTRWGVIAKYDKTYYVKDASFQFYGGYMPSDKTISINDNIVFNLSSTFDDYPFMMYGQNHIQFTDCCIYVNDNSNLWSKNKWLASLGKRTNITRCYFYIKNYNKLAGAFGTDFNITSSVLNQVAVDFGTIKNINDTVFVNTGNSALKYYNKFYTGGTLKDCIFKDSRYGFYTYGTLHNYNVTDCLFKNVDYLMFPNSQTQIVHFNNCTSTSWTVDTSAVTPYLTGQTYRSYTFDARIMNGSSPISSASVKIYNKDNVLKYSGTTNTGGYIPKQILDFCVWNNSYPSTPHLFAPYTINITKTGFKSLNYVFNIATKLNLTIPMSRNTTTAITWVNNHKNTTWSHVTILLANNSWKIFDNDTGNTTTITWFDNHKNTTWSHIKILLVNNSWKIYDNDTGNTTTITWFDNHKNTAWSHIKILLVNNSWKIYDNDTGNITSISWIDNHLRTVWFHNKTLLLNNSWQITDYDVGNYSGLVLINNSVNTTGVINYQFRPFLGVNGEWWVWVNLTGIPTIIPLSNFTVGLNFTNLPGYINWNGSYVANSTNISFVVTSNMSLLGNVTINSDGWLNIASFNINSQLLLLSIFFGLIYLWWKSEKVSMMFVLAMLIVPYDIVVMIVYLLPLYITDTAILLFMRILFLLISIVVMGYTLDYRSKNKKEEKQSGE